MKPGHNKPRKALSFHRAQGDKTFSLRLPELTQGSWNTPSYSDLKARELLFCLFIAVLSILVLSCDLPHQPGPMPSELVETEFEAGLNIMGVLRADGQAGTSFININRALTTEEIYNETIENFAPEVDYVKVTSLRGGTEFLFLAPEDTTGWGYYRDSTLSVGVNEVYHLEIQAPGFPTLTGSTQIPLKPQVVSDSVSVEEGQVSFQIRHFGSAHEYQLFLIFAETVLEKVIKPSAETVIDVDWRFASDIGTPVLLQLTALDVNLTRYGNSPISFIPNTYHPDGSTVTGGYGCFGSVAVSYYPL